MITLSHVLIRISMLSLMLVGVSTLNFDFSKLWITIPVAIFVVVISFKLSDLLIVSLTKKKGDTK